MSRYTVLVKLAMKHEQGMSINAGSVNDINEGYRLGQQVAFQSGHRGQLYISILDSQQNGYCVGNSATFC